MVGERTQCLQGVLIAVRNLFCVVVIGSGLAAIIGLVTGTFLRVLYWLTALTWETIPEAIAVAPGHPRYTVVICTIGGAILGLGREHFGDHPGGVDELVAKIRTGRNIRYSVISKGATNSLISLVFGASLGPELAVATIAGGLGSRVIDRMTTMIETTWTATTVRKSVSLRTVLLTSDRIPQQFGDSDVPPTPRWWWGVPSFAAIICGLIVLKTAAGSGLHFGYPVPRFRSTIERRLIVATLVGVVGGVISVLYLSLRQYLSRVRVTENLLVQSTIGGFLLGVVGAVAPRILFSGQDVVGELFAGVSLGSELLLVAGLTKIVVVSVMLETGWKGGPILPLMAGGATLGVGLAKAMPGVGPVVGLTAMMASLPTAELTRPLIIAGSVGLFFSPSLFLVATVGALAGTICVRLAEAFQLSKYATVP
ncbi:chloride channel protein [Halobium palmae]|uniref:Chloride channel protein n=1 Tax=Halobium palmae TaxID=1776492 RepID=A0ABD5RUJ9_9EURY